MEFIFNILLLLCLFGYGILGEAQLSLKRICGLRDSSGEYKNLDLKIYDSEKKSLNKFLKIEFIGSNGNHHYTLDYQKKINKTFTVVLFDAHFDAKPTSDRIHCGNWVNFAYKNNPYLKKIVAIGMTKGVKFEMAPAWCNYEFIKSGRYIIFPAVKGKSYFKDNVIPEVVAGYSDRCEFDGIGRFFGNPGYYVLWNTPSYDNIRKFIEKGAGVYITIDLDVLKDVKTPYGSGRMDINAVTGIIKNIKNDYEIVGVDICGTDDISSKTDFEEILKCFRKT